VVVLVICSGLDINPFRERTTSALLSALFGSVGLCAALLFLNVAANLSLIADASVPAEARGAKSPLKAWAAGVAAVIALLIAVIAVGQISSERRYLKVVRDQADEVLKQNEGLLQKIGEHLKSDTPKALMSIPEILKFFANQRRDLPRLTLIYPGSFEGRPTLHALDQNDSWNPALPFKKDYFQCTKELDCAYLTDFFSGKKAEILTHLTRRDDDFSIYLPFEQAGARFVLLFSKRQSYGKLGS
jgi:hypothetical protein